MDSAKRKDVYRKQCNGGNLTPRQDRRYERKYWREIREQYKATPDQP